MGREGLAFLHKGLNIVKFFKKSLSDSAFFSKETRSTPCYQDRVQMKYSSGICVLFIISDNK